MSEHIYLPKVRGKYRFDYNLSSLSWFKVGGGAEVLFIPYDLEDLQSFLVDRDSQVACCIIGAGSNMLIRDGGLDGFVIKLGRGFNYVKHTKDYIITGAATIDFNLATYAKEICAGGFEFFSGIPGNIGGAIAMNAGAFGSEISDLLYKVTAIDKNTGEIREFTKDEMGFQYRSHSLDSKWIFTEAYFQITSLEDNNVIQKRIDKIREERDLNQPIKVHTGGSTFKNPIGDKAWKLIDCAGCRGLKIGGAQISNKHCNFIINDGGTAKDIEDLISHVKERVLEETGIFLEEEIKVLGKSLA